MKVDKTVVSKQTPQQLVPGPDAPIDSRDLSSLATSPGETGTPQQSFVSPFGQGKDDPISSPPQIYEPDASFIVKSVENDFSELLTPEPAGPTPASGLKAD